MEEFDVDEAAAHKRTARFWVALACAVVVLVLATFGFSVLISYTTNAFCSCDDGDASAAYTKYARAVDAFAGYSVPPDQHICWSRDYDDEDSGQLYTLFQHPINSEIPWQVVVQGTVCIVSMTVPNESNRTFWSSLHTSPHASPSSDE